MRSNFIDVPVVMTSGYTVKTLQRQVTVSELVPFLEKPFAPNGPTVAVERPMAGRHDARARLIR